MSFRRHGALVLIGCAVAAVAVAKGPKGLRHRIVREATEWRVIEVVNKDAATLAYEVLDGEAAKERDLFARERGEERRFIASFSTEEEAREKAEALERKNLVYGVFEVEDAGGAVFFRVKRVPTWHPRKKREAADGDSPGSLWTLRGRFAAEEAAAAARRRLEEKAVASEKE